MKSFWRYAVALLGFSLLASPAPMLAAKSPTICPQIVRVKYVQGDVRFNPGSNKKPDLRKPWQQATVNLPIQQGFALATGKGRAEIEFEDGSVAYLAGHSVMLFQLLTSSGGVPATQLELLSGTATFSIQTIVTERFGIDTPTDRLEVDYPASAYIRVDSYLDGIAVTPEDNQGSAVDPTVGEQHHLSKGETIRYQSGVRVFTPVPQVQPPDKWDLWVNAQEQKRQAETKAALAASRSSETFPGFTDLYESGRFFSCGALGTCWEPKPDLLSQFLGNPSPAQAPAATAGAPSSKLQSPPTQNALQSSQTAALPASATVPPLVRSDFLFPLCEDYGIRFDRYLDPVTHKWVTRSYFVLGTVNPAWTMRPYFGSGRHITPWDWAECHAGSFAHYHGSYVYVVGKKRHHGPCRWIGAGNATGCVPRHPGDRKGKPPVNLRHGIIIFPKDPSQPIQILHPKPTQPIKILAQTPKQFRGEPFPPNPSAPQPQIEARLMGPTGIAEPKDHSSIAYDYGKKAFVRQIPAAAGAKSGAKTQVVATLSKTGAAWLRPVAWGGKRGSTFAISQRTGTGGAPPELGRTSSARSAENRANSQGGIGGGRASGESRSNYNGGQGGGGRAGDHRAASGTSRSGDSGSRSYSGGGGGRSYGGGGGGSYGGGGGRSAGSNSGASGGGGSGRK